MVKNLKYVILIVAAVCSMGIAMPSCPGQQESQQKIEALQIANNELTQRVRKLQTDLNGLTSDMNQVKQLLPQITNVIQAQRGAIDQLNAAVKDMQKNYAAKNAKGAKAKHKAH